MPPKECSDPPRNLRHNRRFLAPSSLVSSLPLSLCRLVATLAEARENLDRAPVPYATRYVLLRSLCQRCQPRRLRSRVAQPGELLQC